MEERIDTLYMEPGAILAMVDPGLRSRAASVLTELGFEVRALDATTSITSVASASELIILETGDDAALLTRLVYEMYIASGSACLLRIIGVLSVQAFNTNPSVMLWNIADHTAVVAMLSPEDFEINLGGIARRLLKQIQHCAPGDDTINQ